MQVVEEVDSVATSSGPRHSGDGDDSAEDSGVMVAYADDEFVARGQAQAQYAVPVDVPIAEVDKSTILDQVTRNTIERAIWHAQQKSKAESESLIDGANSKGDIYENMTLAELVQERISMKGMNFMDVVRVLDVHIDRQRKEAQEQRNKLESQLIANKLRGLERSQQNRMKDLEMKQERERNDLHQQFAMNERKTMEKHSRAYQTLLADTAGRATGGVILGDDSQQYLSRQNKSASYKTRKPHPNVVKFRKNAQRLRDMGRQEEAENFEEKAAALDEEEEVKWRQKIVTSVTSSAWGASKSKLEKLMEDQTDELTRQKREYASKLSWLDQKQQKAKANFTNVLMAERAKVVAHSKAQAKKRIESESIQQAEQMRERKKSQSGGAGMSNVSSNLIISMAKRDSKVGRDSTRGGSLSEMGIDLSKLNKTDGEEHQQWTP
eukprot:CAMPEP_0119492590 /NCGR_PEP_ID=MMETSP1344-20130328/17088_1 /TAXON_ID=236787 /ORGANISM="Florenciella parvula, Strain CCMP2471" /LENGTH=436 /DNA_ID=CAMNT_0007527933 /DNA_START=83 /DNA_END=1389 /DNA_ORIENTATION=+